MGDAKDMLLALTITFTIAIFLYGCMIGAECNTILLGDDVTTSDRYTTLFNDSFTGRVVAKDDGMYTVRCENGTEREFERHWLGKCGKSTGVLTHTTEELRPNSTSNTPNTALYMNASAAMGMATKDEQGTPMIWVDNTSGIVWIMVSYGHQVPVNVTDIENIETIHSYIDTFEYVDQPWEEI